MAHKWAKWLHNPCRFGGPHRPRAGSQSEVAHKWARWLRNPCRLRGSRCFRAGGGIKRGPQVGKVATQTLLPGGSRPLQTGGGGQNKTWPTSGQGGYITSVAWGGAHRFRAGGAQSEVAQKWARWLHNPCRLRGSRRFTAGGRITSGAPVGKVPTEPLLPGGSRPLQSGGQNKTWPTSGQGGYITSATWGVPTA